MPPSSSKERQYSRECQSKDQQNSNRGRVRPTVANVRNQVVKHIDRDHKQYKNRKNNHATGDIVYDFTIKIDRSTCGLSKLFWRTKEVLEGRWSVIWLQQVNFRSSPPLFFLLPAEFEST